ncbi:MAG: amidohydrolase family protein, partial [Actinomycetota bacterium]
MRLDTLLHNANIHTVDERRRHATAVGVVGEHLVFVGDEAEAASLSARRTVDVGGATVVPGFNDAHQHMSHYGDALRRVDLASPPMTSVADIAEAIAARAASTPPDQWIVGAGYDQNKLAEQRHPTADELERAAPHHPVMLQHTSGHMLTANRRLLALAGVGERPVPAGGEVVVDGEGVPTGLLLEQAQE